MKRRDFLAAGSSLILPLTLNGMGLKTFDEDALAARSLLPGPLAASDNVLVIVYLNGGNDGLNTVIPQASYSKYFGIRANIAVPESKLLTLSGTPGVTLHPSMAGMRDLYNQGKMAIAHSVSYPNPDLSHYRSTDIWMTAVDSTKYAETGWAGRFLDNRYPGYPANYPNPEVKDPLAIQIGYVNTTTLLGRNAPMNVSIQDPASFYQLLGNIETAPSGSVPCCDAGQRISFIRKQQVLSIGYSTEIKQAADAGKNLAEYPTDSLAQQLKIVARLIHGGLQSKIYFVEQRGYDTHAVQVETSDPATGIHAQLLKQLSDAIAAFQQDLKLQGTEQKVIGMTFSDFGRRANSNASFGTDHGVAAPLFVFGTGLKRQEVGTVPNLAIDLVPMVTSQGNPNQDIKMQIDFRRVYRDLLVDWLGASETTSNSILYKNFPTTSLFSDTVHSLSSGMWLDRAIWSTGRMPGPNDIVVINSGHTVLLGQDITVKRIQVEGGGELNLLGNYKITTS